MTDKDKQQMDLLLAQWHILNAKCHEQEHLLMTLRIHTIRQEAVLNRLLALVGLLREDIEDADALTAKDKSFLLRMRRALN